MKCPAYCKGCDSGIPEEQGCLVSIAVVPIPAHVRQEVADFAVAMEEKLALNYHKTHWSKMSVSYLIMRIKQEYKEMKASLIDATPDKVLHECADIANFCMMVADNVKRRNGE